MKSARPFLLSYLISTAAACAAAPVGDGLVFWLDAAAQPAHRQSAALPPIHHLQPVDILIDAAGAGRRATQLAEDRRPVFTSDGETAYLKFDGLNDFLSAVGGEKLSPELTVFVLAAPRANPGNFSALFSTAEGGKNDYTSGLNMDLGPASTDDLSVVNVESAGATGFQDMLVPGVLNAAERPFGGFHVFTVRSRIGKEGTEFFLDGFRGGVRERLESMIGLDQLVVGARHYSNSAPQPPHAQGFFDGAIAEVLVYDRALEDEERQVVEQALLKKVVGLEALLTGAKGHALETVKNPPVAQMLVPGFTIEELPLRIGNINNVRYRHDGKVVALGYDGRIHLLDDSDGDGLEDQSTLFWDRKTMRGPVGMALTPKDDPGGNGVFVPSKGKVSLFLDADGDGHAEEETIIANGWNETFHGVDTLGIAIHPKDGSIYFGLGCTNFADGYLIDKATGESRYDIDSIRGTIQRLSADFSKQETVCTGVRFTCALAFNRFGDLFATDQEGATWLPNGNPFDELLHIERGKHYGFPPRHPKHLPDAIDHPAVFEYGPQHQSAVGMVFNEGVNGGPSFGPDHWQGDALVCGQSRGKIWRTKLVKTPMGYVAQNHLIACLGMLVVDACVTPQGDLLVACHSGPPDWGTGPAGEGRLFKIKYTGREVPQPVTAWASAPDEFRIAFDRPLQAKDWANVKDKIRIEAGRYVSAGDRYEVLRPGYQVVRDQMATPRRWVEVLGMALGPDQQTIHLRVPMQTEPVNYAITLPVPQIWQQTAGIRQIREMDVQVTLNGIVGELPGVTGTMRSVLPHPSLAVSKEFAAGSAEHEEFIKAASAPDAILHLRGMVDLSNPFVPAVQPGSKLDWDMQTDSFATSKFSVRSQPGDLTDPSGSKAQAGMRSLAPLVMKTSNHVENFFELTNGTVGTVLSPQRVLVPWATEEKEKGLEATENEPRRQDVKGDWLRGRRLFFGEAACFTCHTVRGEGMVFAADLGNLVHRDRESVLHDILHPSATINPDHAGSVIRMKDGTSMSGIVRGTSDEIVIVGLPAGGKAEIPADTIESIEPLKVSLMPEGYGERLSAEEQDDLLTFLLINPLEPAPIIPADPPAPAPRPVAEVVKLMPSPPSVETRAGWKPLRILLSADSKDHGVNEHDYPLWLERWTKLLSLAEGVAVETCMGFPTAEQLSAADVTVFYSRNTGWDLKAAELLDAYQKRGGGLVYLHFGIEGGKHALPLAERAGLAFSFSKFRHGGMDLVFSEADHPITRGFSELGLTDESYWRLHGDRERIKVLAHSAEEGEPQPQLWTLERMEGRVFGCIPGHYTWTFDDPLYRLLVLRGICWAAKQPDVERLSELSWIGARFR